MYIPVLLCIKVGYKGYTFHGHVFLMNSLNAVTQWQDKNNKGFETTTRTLPPIALLRYLRPDIIEKKKNVDWGINPQAK